MAGGTALSGSTVLITGGGSGLGRRMALEAARRGARVVIWDVSADGGRNVRDEIRSAGGVAEMQTVNVADKEAVQAAAAAGAPW
jgi:all-trans-retinol dehydrogenase (NAD+)